MTIPMLANFPISWAHPHDAQLFWTLDRTRLPEPITPMTYDYLRFVYHDSFNTVAEAYDLPIRIQLRRFNTYCYSAMVPLRTPPEPVVQGLGWLGRHSPRLVATIVNTITRGQTRRIQAHLDQVIFRLGEVWNDEMLPEIRQLFQSWESFDLPGATLSELLAHLDQTIARTRRLWELHYRIIFPVHTAQTMFAELYSDLFGDEHTFDAYRLFQGFDNKLRDTDQALWQLSRKALASQMVRQALEQETASSVLATLEHSDAGARFLAELRAFLSEHGRRSDKLFELSQPSWIEEPSSVLAILKAYMRQPDRNWAADHDALVATRERLLSGVRERLQDAPLKMAHRFERLLTAAQAAAVIAADHNFWIDLRGPYQARRVMLECGRRIAADGVLDQPEDVFYLTFDELRATADVLPGIDRRQLVAGRRAELAYFRTVSPPPAVGKRPQLPMPNMALIRAVGKALGEPPRSSSEPDVVHGLPGAPGRVRGVARVIRSLEEASKLGKGEVLVTETPAAVWTSLFALAAAVITDAGGILSHGATIAREYGIPAVVGTSQSTRLIRDGRMVEVDGDTGIVRIIGWEGNGQAGHA